MMEDSKVFIVELEGGGTVAFSREGLYFEARITVELGYSPQPIIHHEVRPIWRIMEKDLLGYGYQIRTIEGDFERVTAKSYKECIGHESD